MNRPRISCSHKLRFIDERIAGAATVLLLSIITTLRPYTAEKGCWISLLSWWQEPNAFKPTTIFSCCCRDCTCKCGGGQKGKEKKDGRRTFDWMCKSRWHQHEGFPFHLKSAPWISSSLLLSLQFERSRTRPE